MPSNNAIEFYKGDNKMIRVYVKDENLNIINLNGAECRFYLSSSSKSEHYIFKKSTTDYSQGVILTPEKGEVVFFINTTDTNLLPIDQYFYQVIVILKNSERYTVASGNLNLHNNIEFSNGAEPTPPSPVTEIDIPAYSDFIDISIVSTDILLPVLVAPDNSSDRIWITNLVYSSTTARIYFSTTIETTGWKIQYTKSYV